MLNHSLVSKFHSALWFTISQPSTGISLLSTLELFQEFVGWRLDAGFRFRDVHLVSDDEAVWTRSKGYGRPLQVHSSELVIPETFTSPLFEAQVSKLMFQAGCGTQII